MKKSTEKNFIDMQIWKYANSIQKKKNPQKK